MNRLVVRRIVQVLSNLGVVAGIIFLGLEVRQNNQLVKNQAITALLETRIDISADLATNENLAELFVKNSREEALTEKELLMLTQFHVRNFLGFQKTYFLYQEGVISADYLRTNIPLMKQAFGEKDVSQSPSQTWQAFKAVAPPDYIKFIEQCVLSECEDIP